MIACVPPSCWSYWNVGADLKPEQSHIVAEYSIPCHIETAPLACYEDLDQLAKEELSETVRTFSESYISREPIKVLIKHFSYLDEKRKLRLQKDNNLMFDFMSEFWDTSYICQYTDNGTLIQYFSKDYIGPDTSTEYFLRYSSKYCNWRLCVPDIRVPVSPFLMDNHILFISYKDLKPNLVIIDAQKGAIEEQHLLAKTYCSFYAIPSYNDGWLCVPLEADGKVTVSMIKLRLVNP